MLIKEVKSSSIKSVAYDEGEAKLWLRFSNDALYEYQTVDKQTVNDLLDADSAGKFFIDSIRDKFECTRVEE